MNWKIILLIFGLLVIVGLLVAHFSAPYTIIKRPRSPFSSDTNPSHFGLPFEKVWIQSYDNIFLSGFYIPTSIGAVMGSIIILHGIGGNKENQIWMAKKYTAKGYNCLIMDNRAHGQSEGEYITFGHHEKRDVQTMVDWLMNEKQQINIGVRGTSMGGAIAVQAMAIDKRLRFGIVESTFASLQQTVFDYQKLWLGFDFPFLAKNALRRAGEIAQFSAKDIRPAIIAKEVTQPLLYIHGDADANISVKYGKEVYENAASDYKSLYIVSGAEHHNVYEIGGEKLWERIFEFLEKVNQNE